MAHERLERCFEQCAQPAWRLAVYWLGDTHEAFDVVQQAFVVAATKPGSIPDGDPWPWFRRVVINEARNARRKKKPPTTDKENEMPDKGPDPAQAALNTETARELRQALDSLPENEREALVLTQLQGLTHQQAAESLGMPVKTLSSHVARGLEHMKGRLGSRGEAMLANLAMAPIAVPPGGWEAATVAWKAAAFSAAAKTSAVSIAAGAVLMKKTLAIAGMVVALGVGLGGGAILTNALTDPPSRDETADKPAVLDESGSRHNPLENPPKAEDTKVLKDQLAAAQAAEKTTRDQRDKLSAELKDAQVQRDEMATRLGKLEAELAPIKAEQAERGPTFTFGKHGQIEGVTGSNWKELAAASANVITTLRQIREKQLAGEPVPDELYIAMQKNTEIMRTYEYKTIDVLPTHARHNGEFTHPISHSNLIASELKSVGLSLTETQIAEIEKLGLAWEADYEQAQTRYNATTPRVEKILDEYTLKGAFVDAVWAVLTSQQREHFIDPRWLHVAGTDLYCTTLMIVHTSPIVSGPDVATLRASLQAMLVQSYAIPEAQLEALGLMLDTWQNDVAAILTPVKAAEVRMYTYDQGAVAANATVKLVKAIRDYGMLDEAHLAQLLDAYAIYIPRVVAGE